MVWTDRVSQDVAAVGPARRAPRRAGAGRARALPGRHPARVGRRPDRPHPPLGGRGRQRSARTTVVLHPPFRWQRRYAAAVRRRGGPRGRGRRRRAGRGEHVPGGARPRAHRALQPGLRPHRGRPPRTTRSTSPTPPPRASDALAMLDRMGAGLAHVHLADGSGGPARRAPRARPRHPALRRGAASGWPTAGSRGAVVVEVSTRRCRTRYERAALLAESLLFARLHLQPTAGTRAPAAMRSGAPRAVTPAGRAGSAPRGRSPRGDTSVGYDVTARPPDARTGVMQPHCRRAPVPRRRRDRAARRRPVRRRARPTLDGRPQGARRPAAGAAGPGRAGPARRRAPGARARPAGHRRRLPARPRPRPGASCTPRCSRSGRTASVVVGADACRTAGSMLAATRHRRAAARRRAALVGATSPSCPPSRPPTRSTRRRAPRVFGLAGSCDLRFDPATMAFARGEQAPPVVRGWARPAARSRPTCCSPCSRATSCRRPSSTSAAARLGARRCSSPRCCGPTRRRGGCGWSRGPTSSAGPWFDEDVTVVDAAGRLVCQARQLALAPLPT